MKFIKCANGSLLNVDNIIALKVLRNTAQVKAECVGNRTVDVEVCANAEEAYQRIHEIAGLTVPEKKAPIKKPAIPKPPKKK
jgi:hypothetical protein